MTAPSKCNSTTRHSAFEVENIRFRYKLGADADWVDAGARQVTYGTLPPGSYRFQVIGSGSGGVWNEDGAVFAFQIVPVFYNTWWFRAVVLATIAAAIIVTHRFRVRRLTRQMQLRFEERLDERTRIAQDLHDTLLQGTLAASLHVQLANEALVDAPPSPALEEVRLPLQRAVQLLSRSPTKGAPRSVACAPFPLPATLRICSAGRAGPDQLRRIEFRVIVEAPSVH